MCSRPKPGCEYTITPKLITRLCYVMLIRWFNQQAILPMLYDLGNTSYPGGNYWLRSRHGL